MSGQAEFLVYVDHGINGQKRSYVTAVRQPGKGPSDEWELVVVDGLVEGVPLANRFPLGYFLKWHDGIPQETVDEIVFRLKAVVKKREEGSSPRRTYKRVMEPYRNLLDRLCEWLAGLLRFARS